MDTENREDIAQLARGDGLLVGEETKKQSGSEAAMFHLETEILKTKELFTTLRKRLGPVLIDKEAKSSEPQRTVDPVPANSPLASSIAEKTAAIRGLRWGIEKVINDLDI